MLRSFPPYATVRRVDDASPIHRAAFAIDHTHALAWARPRGRHMSGAGAPEDGFPRRSVGTISQNPRWTGFVGWMTLHPSTAWHSRLIVPTLPRGHAAGAATCLAPERLKVGSHAGAWEPSECFAVFPPYATVRRVDDASPIHRVAFAMGFASIRPYSTSQRSTGAAGGPKWCAPVLGSRPPRDDPSACRIVRGRPCS